MKRLLKFFNKQQPYEYNIVHDMYSMYREEQNKDAQAYFAIGLLIVTAFLFFIKH